MSELDHETDQATAAFQQLIAEQRAGFAQIDEKMAKLEKRLPDVTPSIVKMEDAIDKIEPLVASIKATPMLQTTLSQQVNASTAVISDAATPLLQRAVADQQALRDAVGVIRAKDSQKSALIAAALAGAIMTSLFAALLLWATDRLPLPRAPTRMTAAEKFDLINEFAPAIVKNWDATVEISKLNLSRTFIDEMARCTAAAQKRSAPARCSLAVVPPR